MNLTVQSSWEYRPVVVVVDLAAAPVKTNDLKKGTMVLLRGTNWLAKIVDNTKGNIRTADVEGFFREIGGIYAHDILAAEVVRDGTKVWVPVELTPAQLKLQKTVENL